MWAADERLWSLLMEMVSGCGQSANQELKHVMSMIDEVIGDRVRAVRCPATESEA